LAEVLVVDDSKVMRDMIAACLTPNASISVTHASTGLEAIEKLSLRTFDAVVLDLNMPDIGGLEVLEFVRSQDRLRALPIVVVTTRGDETSRTKALDAGATRFMTKPFTPDAILGEVNAVLGNARAVLDQAAG
jgi:two-component system, chemotaxis family, chemotaxis protein CheY